VASWFDDSSWPILKVRLPPYPSDEDLTHYFQLLASYRNRRQPYGLLMDVTHARSFSPTQRRMQAEYIRDGLPLSRIYLKAIAYVAETALKRGAITAIYWLVPPASPYQIFGQRAEADRWLAGQLGLPR
jgi:hypothetical protein